MRSLLVVVLAALVALSSGASSPIPVSAVASGHDLQAASSALDELNAQLRTEYKIQAFTPAAKKEDNVKEWTLTTDSGNIVVVQADAQEKLYAAWSVDEEGTRTMIFHVKATPSSTAWILGIGLLFVALGVIVVMSSKPSSLARERAAPVAEKVNTSPTSSAARRRRSKLD